MFQSVYEEGGDNRLNGDHAETDDVEENDDVADCEHKRNDNTGMEPSVVAVAGHCGRGVADGMAVVVLPVRAAL